MHRRSDWEPLRSRVIGVSLLVLLLPGLGACTSMGHWLMTPSEPFNELVPPPPPDYANPDSWVARPGMDSAALEIPEGVAAPDPAAIAKVDVFYLHPTTYFWRWAWNAEIHGWLSDTIISIILRNQASIFNGVGRIYAPHYRQLTLSAFDGHPDAMEKGLDLAYSDVRRAFLYFLENWNEERPIFLVGHSQGSRLLLRLLDEFFKTPPLRDRLIAAYPVGTRAVRGPDAAIPGDLPVCASPEQTGCLISWRTFARGSPEGPRTASMARDRRIVCVNPLTWEASEPSAPASANLGSIPMSIFDLSRPEPGLIGGDCEDGAIWINPPEGWAYTIFSYEGDFHAEDYNLFYMNVRENAQVRARSFLAE